MSGDLVGLFIPAKYLLIIGAVVCICIFWFIMSQWSGD